MKLTYLIPLLLIFSCKPIKIKEIKMDLTQDLIGEIEQINVTTFHYPLNSNDTIISTENSIITFNSKNKITKQIDSYSKFTEETTFIYNHDLLVSTISKNGNRVRKIEYKYDNKKNIIEYKELENDTIYFIKTSIYDEKNNPINQTYLFPNYKSNNSLEKFETDYKNRTVKIQSFDENDKIKNHYLKTYFNKNGYIIKTETIYNDSNNRNSRSSIINYDKLGNLLSRISFDNSGNIKVSTEYKNTFDEKGNIIIREKYSDEKLVQKKTYQITYQ